MKTKILMRDNATQSKHGCKAVRNSVDEATIYIYDIIDAYWGVSAIEFIAALNDVADAKVLHLRINSPGGDVFEGRAIVEAIKGFVGKTIAHVDSLAASAASSIAIAADGVEIAAGAFFMIHNARAMVWGDKKNMRDTADLLERVEGTIVKDYIAKTGETVEEIVAWMDAETWFTGDEAVDAGFADRISTVPDGATNKAWNLAAFNKVPAPLIETPNPPKPEVKPEPNGTAQTNNNALRLAMIV